MDNQRVLLKDQLFNRDKVAQIAAELSRAQRSFDASAFEGEVMSRLPELELKQRIGWIADRLEASLPSDYRRAVKVLLRSLPAPCDPALSDGDFGDFIYAPYAEYVARHGCTREDLTFSLTALRELTTRFSAEDAIRTFINTFPDETLTTLTEWTTGDHYHVRRLCSEGTRPKLPWARRLTTAVGYAVPLLDRLYCDPTRFVTRSVANHVNDISKLDPDLAVDTLRRWMESGQQKAREMDYVVRHATRSLVKQGNPRAMELLGVPARPAVTVSKLHIPKRVELGSALEFSFTIRAQEDTEVIADYVLHYQGRGGRLTGRKVYKLKRLALANGEQAMLTRRHLLRADMTTREIRPGRHELEIQLNGLSQCRYSFWVTALMSD
jgi:3-methyladenine DNA glycosylase AlkC